MQQLPIDAHVAEVLEAVRSRGAAVVVAPPGAGKTTRVPPALVGEGPLLLLQPRRVAARSLARRIAAERGWTLGEEIGWQVRFERRFSKRTRLLVATEGVLTARLQGDPLLSDFTTVVLDEFHERNLHADLGLALLREARDARDDLRVVVMSATIDPAPIAAYLGNCPIVEIAVRGHPLQIDHEAHIGPTDAVLRVLQREAGGHLLVFLPGAPEIERAARELRPHLRSDCDLFPLHGSLDADAQDCALAPSPSRRKVILATNIAETSLTVDGVTDVVDGGLHKVLRRDPALGLDRLELERIPRDSADQRAGRAGRSGPGRVLRLWDARDELRERREPEIRRVDLAAPLLTVLAQGADPATFQWFERPDDDSLAAAMALLERLGAARERSITALGRALLRLPVHPRLGRVLLGCDRPARAAAACAVLDEGWHPRGVDETTPCDLLPAVDRIERAPPRVRDAARQLERAVAALDGDGRRRDWIVPGEGERQLRLALLAAYPDRVAQRRERGSPRLKLAGGHGAVLGAESGVRDGDFLVALELRAGRRGAGAEARVARAARIEREWLEPTGRDIVHEFDADGVRVRAVEREMFETLVLAVRATAADPETAARLRCDALLARGFDARVEATLRRLRFAGVEIDLVEALLDACRTHPAPFEFDALAALDRRERARLERLAPEKLRVPSGREVALDYREDGSIVAAVKLQELFGLADTPRLGPAETPLTFSLLAPNGRPVQTTRDLRSFWNGAYAEVRAELRGRYPKHPWPEDPWSAEPTGRTRKRWK